MSGMQRGRQRDEDGGGRDGCGKDFIQEVVGTEDLQQWLGQRGLCVPQPASWEMPHDQKMFLPHRAPGPFLWYSEMGWSLTGPHRPLQPPRALWVTWHPC